MRAIFLGGIPVPDPEPPSPPRRRKARKRKPKQRDSVVVNSYTQSDEFGWLSKEEAAALADQYLLQKAMKPLGSVTIKGAWDSGEASDVIEPLPSSCVKSFEVDQASSMAYIELLGNDAAGVGKEVSLDAFGFKLTGQVVEKEIYYGAACLPRTRLVLRVTSTVST